MPHPDGRDSRFVNFFGAVLLLVLLMHAYETRNEPVEVTSSSATEAYR